MYRSRYYSSVHARVRRLRGSACALLCVDCGDPAQEWSYAGGCSEEHLEGSLAYCHHPEHYDPRCRACHRAYDEHRGERHHLAQLTENDVRSIRARYAAGEIGQRALGREYKVAQTTVRDILIGKTWKHVQ